MTFSGSFRWSDRRGAAWGDRFDVVDPSGNKPTGADEWQAAPWDALGTDPALPSLTPSGAPPRPRVFISHRDRPIDVCYAERVAWLANDNGWDYWLDVLDPSLVRLTALAGSAPSPVHYAFAVAFLVEIALLNCTHVLVVMTGNSKGSGWIPYEYGRVKTKAVLTTQAVAWLDPTLRAAPGSLPEYLHLGPQLTSELAIETWMRKYHAGSPISWRGPPTTPLP